MIKKDLNNPTILQDKKKIYKTAVIIVFLWFTLQVTYIALTVKFNIASDEGFHWDLINVYRDRNSLLPFIKEQNNFFWLRDITRNPSYLYHYLLGLLFKIRPLQHYQEIILRFINILFNLLNLYILKKLLDELTQSKWIKFLTLFMMANTLMYVFLSMGINYDNVINPLATLSILLTIKFLKEPKLKFLAFWILSSFLGMLVKYAFGPVIFIEAIILVIELIATAKSNNKNLFIGIKIKIKSWTDELRKYSSPVIIVITVIIALLTFLFIERYGINLIKFKTIGEPDCAEIHSIEKCLQSSVYKRNYNLLQEVKKHPERANFSFSELFTTWVSFMLSRTFGMMVHKWMDPNPFTVTGFVIISALSFLYFVRYFDLHKNKKIRIVFIIALFYTIFLMLYVNYLDQKKFGSLGLAVQGRYIFPVLGIWYFLLNRNIIKGLNKLNLKVKANLNFFKYLYTVFVIVLFLDGGFFWYLREAGKDWYKENRKPAVTEKT